MTRFFERYLKLLVALLDWQFRTENGTNGQHCVVLPSMILHRAYRTIFGPCSVTHKRLPSSRTSVCKPHNLDDSPAARFNYPLQLSTFPSPIKPSAHVWYHSRITHDPNLVVHFLYFSQTPGSSSENERACFWLPEVLKIILVKKYDWSVAALFICFHCLVTTPTKTVDQIVEKLIVWLI